MALTRKATSRLWRTILGLQKIAISWTTAGSVHSSRPICRSVLKAKTCFSRCYSLHRYRLEDSRNKYSIICSANPSTSSSLGLTTLCESQIYCHNGSLERYKTSRFRKGQLRLSLRRWLDWWRDIAPILRRVKGRKKEIDRTKGRETWRSEYCA